jgi:tetratricopeptide (TPR) repeat protein
MRVPMPTPRTVVIPFGVPEEGRGLGLGIAALLQAAVEVQGEGVAIAQLHGRRKDDATDATVLPVEAFVTPEAWRDIAARGDAPLGVSVVVTGAFEPPAHGQGTMQLLAFDAEDGHTRARIEVPLDESRAGALFVQAIEQLGSPLGANIGPLDGLRDLDWDPLESVLYAERCALHDPTRGGPHNSLAALAHLGRAIQEAPAARYPIQRLAALTQDAVSAPALDGTFATAAARALERAIDDAPEQMELVESLALMKLRLGQPREGERLLNAAIATVPRRQRLYALLAQSLRAQGNADGALSAVEAGAAATGEDLLLSTERGAALAMRGDLAGAAAVLRRALARDPVYPAAFVSLAGLALRTQDADAAALLVDAALGAARAHPDVLRHAVRLALASEAEGLARASRVATLCRKLLVVASHDAWASLALAQACLTLGETAAARERLLAIQRTAPGSAPAAEAQALALSLDDPGLAQSLEGLTRAANTAPAETLEDIAARLRKLGTLHDAWPAWLAAAIADRRSGRWASARGSLEVALQLAPGAVAAHIELALVLEALGDFVGARDHAQRAVALEGETPRVLQALGRVLLAGGKRNEGDAAKPAGLAFLKRWWAGK